MCMCIYTKMNQLNFMIYVVNPSEESWKLIKFLII